MSEGVRIDKWLWAVRIFKTRSLASDHCKSAKVTIGGISVKPSKIIHIDEVISVKRPPAIFSYKVKGLISKRVSASLAAKHVENITPQAELDKLAQVKESVFFKRERGTGRPTKKERRDIDKLRT
ncbi:MAG: RNA-binding S4 domain-containing protein [Bacteroidales bacterium]|nr:RNA-binding S4 domain-containing protein [Bacteroidales bacterium]